MNTSMNKITLLPHQQRVVDEADELSEKLEKLNAFIGGVIFGRLNPYEQRRLMCQAYVMGWYLTILKDRIAAFLVDGGENV